ncbi:MAG: hypothetical protein Q4B42_06610 [Oscillospiraceae bacterium]|nr:hypothetical protein [Oscillospiraceae bacterium]
MSGNANDKNEYASGIDGISSDLLKDFLRIDHELGDEGADTDMICRITDELVRREEYDDGGIDADSSWEEFRRKHLSGAEEPERRGEEAGLRESGPRRAFPLKKLLRTGGIIAAVMAIVISGAITVSARQSKNSDGVATWTKDYLWLCAPVSERSLVDMPGDEEREIPEQLQELAAAMTEAGISSKMLPTYLPEGLVLQDLYFDDFHPLFGSVYGCFLARDNEYIDIEYGLIEDGEFMARSAEYCKNVGDPEVLHCGELTFYIICNVEDYVCVWIDGDIVCSFIGFKSRDEMIKTVESIYGELE